MSTLAEDIAAEFHTFLLESGNLVKKKPAGPPPIVSATPTEYLCRIQRYSCACGSIHSLLEGVFLVKTAPEGARILSSLRFPLLGVFNPEKLPFSVVKTESSVPLCADCAPFLETL